MKYLVGFAVILSLFSINSFASANYGEIASDANKQSVSQIASYKEELQKYQANSNNILRKYKMDWALNDRDASTVNSTTSKNEEKINQIIVFISFSMPDQTIKEYLNEASRINASVVIRGLVHNSFKETFVKVTSLVKDIKSGGVQLDPVEFERFNVNKVPTIVVVPKFSSCFNTKKCASNNYDSVAGNIGIEAALLEIEKKGNIGAGIAHDAIGILRGNVNA